MNATIHSFVIRVWLEEGLPDSGGAVWRGHITHVESKARRHFDRLAETLDFIQPFLVDRNLLLEFSLDDGQFTPVEQKAFDDHSADHRPSENRPSDTEPSDDTQSVYDSSDHEASQIDQNRPAAATHDREEAKWHT